MGPQDANNAGFVHGGIVMKMCDEAGGIAAVKHSRGRVVTAAMDRMTFLEPVHLGHLVTCRASVNAVWRTSMEVGVRVMAERWNESGSAKQVASAYLVFVAVDAEGKPRNVPPVLPETDADRRREQEAQIRRTHRLARRRAIVELRRRRAAEGLDD
ncbi:MAG TPA: acyl-CoA thioesterase [Streptomyces sp.]